MGAFSSFIGNQNQEPRMSIADAGMAGRAGAIIARWGKPAQLLRGGTLRDCVCAILDHNPRARGLEEQEAERALVAAPLDIEPDHEQDALIFSGRKYAIVSPVKGPRPADIPIYFDLDVVYRSSYP